MSKASNGGHKPSRSGADTSRTTSIVGRGGKLDPAALRQRMQASDAALETPVPAPGDVDDSAPGADASEQATGESPAIVNTGDADQVVSAVPDEDAVSRVVFVLQRDLNKRLDKYLCDRIAFMSRTQLQGLIDSGGVIVNGRVPKSSTKLRLKDRVEVYVPPPPPTEIQPEDIPLEVIFEDEHIIVINKRPDFIVHPARAHNKGTMINALAFHFQNCSPTGGSLSQVGKEFARPGVVHRLDRNTSGLIVFAKSDQAHWKIGQQFENRTVDKRYLALIHGVLEPPIDTIDLPLGPHPSKERGLREKYVVRHDHLGKHSLTIARLRQAFYAPEASEAQDELENDSGDAQGPGVIDVAPGWKQATRDVGPLTPRKKLPGPPATIERGFALVELELKTGRTHQIRVHLSHRGYPIVGDDLYSGRLLYVAAACPPGRKKTGVQALITLDEQRAERTEAGPVGLLNRQALHAASLQFKHPITGRLLSFTAPLPPDMREALRILRSAHPGADVQSPSGSTLDLGAICGGETPPVPHLD